jgi:hypothetical protein
VSVLKDALVRNGFAFVHAAAMRAALDARGALTDWAAFAESWNQLDVDAYMADGGRYRRRRHAVFLAGREGAVARQAHQPHYQSLDYNPLHGGVARWFAPMTEAAAEGPSLHTVLGFARDLFSSLAPATESWRIEVHQFRIEARPGAEGRPTPEGLHRDGVDYVLVLLINRCNIGRGTTAIHALDGRLLGSFTLTEPMDAALVEDARVAHGVTPVDAIDPEAPAFRDVLVVTFVAADAYPPREPPA